MPFNLQDVRAQLTTLQAAPAPRYAYFKGDWCPDCVRSTPVVQQVIGALPGATMLEIDVGERAEWKSPDHPLRHDPELKLTGIPTLFAWGTSGAGEKLGPELEAARSSEEAEELITAFVERTKGSA